MTSILFSIICDNTRELTVEDDLVPIQQKLASDAIAQINSLGALPAQLQHWAITVWGLMGRKRKMMAIGPKAGYFLYISDLMFILIKSSKPLCLINLLPNLLLIQSNCFNSINSALYHITYYHLDLIYKMWLYSITNIFFDLLLR